MFKKDADFSLGYKMTWSNTFCLCTFKELTVMCVHVTFSSLVVVYKKCIFDEINCNSMVHYLNKWCNTLKVNARDF